MSPRALFELGEVVITRGAMATLNHAGELPWGLLLRHQSGDWGEIHPEDAELNREALAEGMRVLSCYDLAPSGKVWIITESDRSLTTLLLPEEY